jgi:16S rRNA (cytosine1402-N4)-methyltransferase
MTKNKNSLLHTSVLVNETINFLSINKNHLYIDGTFGDGGHSKAIL